MSIRKKPWNRTDHPVYSISSTDGKENNMHIISYVTAISMQPKRYVVGVYEGTKTLDLINKNPVFVLQILSQKQASFVRLLGQQSGKKVNKIERLKKRKLLTDWEGFPILKEAAAVLLLRATESFDGGDHRGFVCDVLAHKYLNDETILTLNYLREKKIIRG